MSKDILDSPLRKINELEAVVLEDPEPIQKTFNPQTGKISRASFHQERIWFIDSFERGHLYDKGPTYHNIPIILCSEKPLQIEGIKKATQYLCIKHEALRTHAWSEDNLLFQIIEEYYEPFFESITLNNTDHKDDQTLDFLCTLNEKAFESGLDDSLFKVFHVICNDKHYVLLSLHHFICDDISTGIIMNEFAQAYCAFKKGVDMEVTPHPLPYVDFSNWQRTLAESHIEDEYMFWKEKLSEPIEKLELPIDHKRAAIHIYSPKTITQDLPDHCVKAVDEYCVRHKVLPNMVYLAVFKILLMKYSGLNEIVIGSSAKSRTQTEFMNTVGPISNLITLSDNIQENQNFNEILATILETYENAHNHCTIPFDQLVVKLKPKNDMSRTALFDVIYNYDENHSRLKETPFTHIELNRGYGKYDYNLLVKKDENHTRIILTYNELYYNDHTAQSLADGFCLLCQILLSNPEKKVSKLSCLSNREYDLIVHKWNAVDDALMIHDTIITVFREQVKKAPDTIAVVDEISSLTYGALDQKSSQIAKTLHNCYGIGRGDIVSLVMDKSVDCLTLILAILKVGATYLPIDPQMPRDRIAYMLSDSSPELIIAQKQYSTRIQGNSSECILLEEILSESQANTSDFFALTDPEDPAYILYTSGTTGYPKGMIINNNNVTRLIFNGIKLFNINSNDTWIMAHSYCFDFSVWEMYGALLTGGKLIIVNKDITRNPADFRAILKNSGVTILNQTPMAFYALIQEERCHTVHDLSVSKVIFGGEALHVEKLKDWDEMYPQCHLINMYGTTETTVHVTYKHITKEEILKGHNSIGRPLPTYTVYIIDRECQCTPVGVAGELAIGGSGVGIGYHNRPELTAEKFIDNPYGEGKLYRSGDWARWLPDGSIEYLGRMDDQVKIRGFRIELGEIESALRNIEGVKDCAVVVRGI